MHGIEEFLDDHLDDRLLERAKAQSLESSVWNWEFFSGGGRDFDRNLEGSSQRTLNFKV